jgi:Putative peptidoglycan binding domain/FecR protein
MFTKTMARRISATLALMLPSLAAVASADGATLTIVEGGSAIVTGGRSVLAAAGMRLTSCDIAQTESGGLMQFEMDDGTTIELGSGSRFLADIPGGRGAGATTGPHFLLSGWLKLTVPPGAKTAYRVNSGLADLVVGSGVVVVHAEAATMQLFVERGEAAVFEVGRGAKELRVGAGQTYSRSKGSTDGEVSGRPGPDFLAAMPRAFRDTLPSRLAAAAALKPTPEPGPQVGLRDLQEWFRGDPEPRRCLLPMLVRNVQQALDAKGFDVGPIDGVLGPRTQGALRAFQAQQGLERSGQLDEQTITALNLPNPRSGN